MVLIRDDKWSGTGIGNSDDPNGYLTICYVGIPKFKYLRYSRGIHKVWDKTGNKLLSKVSTLSIFISAETDFPNLSRKVRSASKLHVGCPSLSNVNNKGLSESWLGRN